MLESTSVSYGKATSYLPIIELLRSYFQIDVGDDARKIREKATGKLLSLDRALEPFLPALLGVRVRSPTLPRPGIHLAACPDPRGRLQQPAQRPPARTPRRDREAIEGWSGRRRRRGGWREEGDRGRYARAVCTPVAIRRSSGAP